MDQCSRCSVKHNVTACESTDCSFHELWYVKQLKIALQSKELATDKQQPQLETPRKCGVCGGMVINNRCTCNKLFA